MEQPDPRTGQDAGRTGARPDPDRPDPARAHEEREAEKKAARARIEQQHTWVDLQVRRAMERGDFDDLPGAGKPIEGLGEQYDPEWWVKRLVERERIAVLPPALQLRKDDAELDPKLDAMASETEVRAFVEDFNERVIRARYTPVDGPPLITMPRDVEETVAGWRERRSARRTAAAAAAAADTTPPPRRRRWWSRHRS